MKFEVRDTVVADGVLMVSVRGELDLDTAGELRRRLGLRSGGTPPRVIDLSECSFIDSTGLSMIVRAYRRANSDGGGGFAIVASPGSQVRHTLRLTNIDSNIPVLGSVEAALGTLGRTH
jgi:anti-sigma B factor antagonist